MKLVIHMSEYMLFTSFLILIIGKYRYYSQILFT